MLEEYQIIRKPIVTERSTKLKEENNQVVFEVDRRANKAEIAKAVERLFKVTVLSVRTQNREGKAKRLGRSSGRRRHWKKAIVRVKEGDRVDFFEAV